MRVEILVLRLSSLGDVVLSSAFLQSAMALWPNARITYVVRADLAPVAAALPGVTHVVAVERDLGVGGLARLGAELGRRRWTHVFDLHQSARSRWLCAAMRRRSVSGFDKQELQRFALLRLRRDVYARFGGARSLRERMLEPLRWLGLEPPIATTRLVVPKAARDAADDVLRSSRVAGATCIGIAPGSRWPSKTWGEARFAALVRALAAPDRRLLVFGSAAERVLCEQVASAEPACAAALAGHLDILATAAALERCSVVVSNDSGLLHVAEAMGRPVVALFGPTAPQFGYAPHRPESLLLRQPPLCSPCSKNGSRPCWRPTHECMEAIEVTAVTAAVERVLARATVPSSR